MEKIIVGTDYRLNVIMNTDITGGSVKIKYKKPDTTTGEFNGVVDDAAAGTAHCDISATQNDQHGTWHFWPVVTMSNNKTLKGPAKEVEIHREGV